VRQKIAKIKSTLKKKLRARLMVKKKKWHGACLQIS
jgi:hypothetical protein